MTTDNYGGTILIPVTDQNISPSQYGVPVRNAIIDLDARLQNTNAGLVSYVRKLNTDTVTNSTSLHQDSELSLPVLANQAYALDAFIIYTAPTANDFTLGWATSPGTTTGLWTPGAMVVGGTTGLDGFTDHKQYPQNVTPTVGGAGAQNLVAMIRGIVFGGVTDGSWTFRFAEGTAGAATSAVVLPGSWMSLTPMA